MIEVSHLTKYYGKKLALDDISFSIQSGEVVGLLGLNGAGKSTTMNILTGFISPTEGSVLIDGHDIVSESKEAKKVIGYLPELFSFYPEMRVNEYLDYVCDLKGIPADSQKREAHISAVCKEVGITDMRPRMIRNLSKGYKQRVGFAQALIGNPKLLILDEPTIGLDPEQIIEIRQLIRNTGKSSTVIISSHILSEIQVICSRVIVINGGKIIADDTPKNLVEKASARNKVAARIQGEPQHVTEVLQHAKNVISVKRLSQKEPDAWDYVIEGREGEDIRADVFHALSAADLPLLSTYSQELTLEDVFLHLIADKNPNADSGAKS